MGLTERSTRLGHGALTERVELLLAEPVEILVRRQLLHGGQWELDSVEVGVERALGRPGVDVDHRRDLLRDAIGDRVAGSSGAAVHGEHDGGACRLDRLADRVDVVGHRDRGAIGVGRLEPGQRQRRDVVAVRTERGGDLVPRPRAEPEPWNEDDRCGAHSSTLPDLMGLRPRSGRLQGSSRSETRE